MRFLVLGLGSIGTRHARNLLALGHEVVGWDTAEKPKVPLGADFCHPDAVGNIDGCIIATPTLEHANDIHYAAEHGYKHVLVEKPIADRVSERLISDLQYASEVGIHIVMGNNLRFHPSAKLARRYIKEGHIGNPIWAHIACAQYSDKPDYLRDGVTLNWSSHECDLALHLLGPANVIAASIDNKDTIADFCLLHENGCRSTIHVDYLTNPEMRQIVIFGDKGRLVCNLVARYVALQTGEIGQPPDKQGGSFDEDYENEIAAFVNLCQGKPWPGAFAQDGIDVLTIIDAARKIAK